MEGFKAALFKRFLEKVIMRSRTKEQKIRYYIFRVMTAGNVSCGQDWKHITRTSLVLRANLVSLALCALEML